MHVFLGDVLTATRDLRGPLRPAPSPDNTIQTERELVDAKTASEEANAPEHTKPSTLVLASKDNEQEEEKQHKQENRDPFSLGIPSGMTPQPSRNNVLHVVSPHDALENGKASANISIPPASVKDSYNSITVTVGRKSGGYSTLQRLYLTQGKAEGSAVADASSAGTPQPPRTQEQVAQKLTSFHSILRSGSMCDGGSGGGSTNTNSNGNSNGNILLSRIPPLSQNAYVRHETLLKTLPSTDLLPTGTDPKTHVLSKLLIGGGDIECSGFDIYCPSTGREGVPRS